MPQLIRRTIAMIVTLPIAISALVFGCAKEEERHVEERGRHVRVRAPFTKVDVWIPEDDDEDPRVDVDVDD